MKKLSIVLVALVALTFTGCTGWDIPDDAQITLQESSVVLHSGETYQIVAECVDPITYTSGNEYYASVTEMGKVTANFVGNTFILLESESDKKTFELTIAPLSNLYPEPQIEFGESIDNVTARYGTPDESGTETVAYYNYSENVLMLMVMIDDAGNVTNYAVVLDTSYEEELGTFLDERYMFYNEQDGVKVYMNALTLDEADMLVGSQVYENQFLMAVYMSHNTDAVAMSAKVMAALKEIRK